MINYFDKQKPLTISMWDFSWLMANHPGGAFENLEARVEEAAERGYNTLHIDCFPSDILQERATFKKNWNNQTQMPRWGQVSVDFECNVLEKLSYLAELCRKNGIWLGLDTWEQYHVIGGTNIIEQKEEEKVFKDISSTWVKAIRLMREAGVLERAVWIAPMNEVPYFANRYVRSIIQLDNRIKNEGETFLEINPETDEKMKRINHWMGEAIKDEVKKDGIPLSYSSHVAERYANRLTDIYDVVDVHFMPLVVMDDEDKISFEQAGKGASLHSNFNTLETFDLSRYSQVWADVCQKNYGKMLERTREYHESALNNMVLASGKKLIPVITESFGPCYFPDHKNVDWTWYKKYNADAVRIVSSLPFAGTSLSNYAEPLFRLWDDKDWHRNSNHFITSFA